MIIIYFKDPAISLVMDGELSEQLVEDLGQKLGAAEITEEEWQTMKRNRDAARARSIIPPFPDPVGMKIPKKN